MQPSRSLPVFWKNLAPKFSGLKSKPSKQSAISGCLFSLIFEPADKNSTFLQNISIHLRGVTFQKPALSILTTRISNLTQFILLSGLYLMIIMEFYCIVQFILKYFILQFWLISSCSMSYWQCKHYKIYCSHNVFICQWQWMFQIHNLSIEAFHASCLM